MGSRTGVQVVSCPSDSGIPHGQPWGMQHTYEGALARLHHLRERGGCSGYDYLVSAENGVVAFPQHHGTEAIDIACVVVERALTGEQAMNFSQARPYPLTSIQKLKQ